MDINALNIGENRQILQFSGYSYQEMKNDLHIYQRIFEDIVQINTIGRTIDGREIFHLRIGADNARNQILIFAGIHGREYMTCQLVMDQTADYARALLQKQSYKGISYEEMSQICTIHVIPMVNPDGVTISQMGPDAMQKEEVRKQVWAIAGKDRARMPWKKYFRYWKANAQGIDVNRNFDALWETYSDGMERPSSERYKGSAPGCTAEARALVELTEKENFARTISYHSSGAVIYWSFGQKGALAQQTKNFAKRIGNITGYTPDDDYEELDPAGYKDWALLKKGIPSLTIEIGRSESPLPPSAYKRIYRENQHVWEETILDILEEQRTDLCL